MTGRATFRSPLAIVTSLSNTAPYAFLTAFALVALWDEATGADRAVAYGAAAFAVTLVALPLLQRLTIAADGLVVANAVVRTRLPWEEVAEVGVANLRATVFWYFGVWAPGITVRKRSGIVVDAYATIGLRRRSRRRLAEAIAAAAAHHGFRNEVTAEALAWRGRQVVEAPALDEPATTWAEGETDSDAVECIFCGRLASPDEMQPLDQPGPPAWHCRDGDVCTAGETAEPASTGY